MREKPNKLYIRGRIEKRTIDKGWSFTLEVLVFLAIRKEAFGPGNLT